MNNGARPGGSTITRKDTNAETANSGIRGQVTDRPGHQVPSGIDPSSYDR